MKKLTFSDNGNHFQARKLAENRKHYSNETFIVKNECSRYRTNSSDMIFRIFIHNIFYTYTDNMITANKKKRNHITVCAEAICVEFFFIICKARVTVVLFVCK